MTGKSTRSIEMFFFHFLFLLTRRIVMKGEGEENEEEREVK